ncbi:hypothetical protein [Methanolobus sp. WCC5]|uniref:hypothetical protein n=1 Tax=Methanolobus sp. WCC5 TaxID=3125785 RepID=UPI00324EB4F6
MSQKVKSIKFGTVPEQILNILARNHPEPVQFHKIVSKIGDKSESTVFRHLDSLFSDKVIIKNPEGRAGYVLNPQHADDLKRYVLSIHNDERVENIFSDNLKTASDDYDFKYSVDLVIDNKVEINRDDFLKYSDVEKYIDTFFDEEQTPREEVEPLIYATTEPIKWAIFQLANEIKTQIIDSIYDSYGPELITSETIEKEIKEKTRRPFKIVITVNDPCLK